MDRITKLKEYLVAMPEDNFLLHALGLEYLKISREEDARECFESILRRDPSYIGTYYHLAQLLVKMGERDKAVEWYEKGLAAAKAAGDQHAYNELQSAYEDLVY
jgi:Tfp pilus assembly protein PilF